MEENADVEFKVTNGAMPETGVDPINIAHNIYSSLLTILTREIPAVKPGVITIGKFVGGDAPNIIPDEVIMEGTFRYLDKEMGGFVIERMNEIVTSTAKTFRGEAEFIELSLVPPLTNNNDLAHEITGYMKDIVGEQAVMLCLYYIIGAGAKHEGAEYRLPMHNGCVVFNEEILLTGAALHTHAAITWLKNNKENLSIIIKIKSRF